MAARIRLQTKPCVSSLQMPRKASEARLTLVQVAAGVASGLFFAVAAGNEGVDARYSSPASEPSVCTVGASSMNDTMPSWSNYGSSIDVLAPGTNITSLNNDGGTAMHDGTSMATPHVAGLAAYLLGLQGGGTEVLCERIANMGLQGVVKNVRKGTKNVLINNGALSAYPNTFH